MPRIFESKQPYIAMRAYVDPTAVVIGDVEIGEHSSIWPKAVLRGDVQAIRIGDRTNIQDGAIVHVTHASDSHPAGISCRIGDEVTIAHNAVVHSCVIGDRCLIGIGAIILDGVTIPSNVIIGAGSLVPPGKTLESGYLYLGSPAEKIRKLTDEEKRFIESSAEQYVVLKERYLVVFTRNRERERERI